MSHSLCVVGRLLVVLLMLAAFGSAQWWNTSYAFRQQINVSNGAADALPINYSVLFTLDTTGANFQADGDDVRIVYDNGTDLIELDRINESAFNDASTNIWFAIQDSIPAGEWNASYYVYHGNDSVSDPPDNRSKVYLWFDDFNRADNADITTESAYKQYNAGTWSIEDQTLKNTGADGDPNKLIVDALGPVNFDVDMQVKLNVSSWPGTNTDYERMGLTANVDNDGGDGQGYCALFHEDQNSLDLLNDQRSWGTETAYAWSLNTWYTMRFQVIDPTTKTGKIKVWEAGSAEPGSWTVDGTFGAGAARDYGEVGIAGSDWTDVTYFDDLLIRYVVATEPTASLLAKSAPPSIGVVTVDDADSSPANEVDLVAGGARVVNCSAVVSDDDGYGDVAVDGSVVAEFYETAQGLDDYSGNNDDENYRYTNTSCAFSGGSGTDVTATCSFTVQYYANPGGWTCSLNATDGSGATVAATATVTVNTLTALSAPSSLDFGSLNLGDTSADALLTVTNTGNEQIDVSLDGFGAGDGDGYAMVCDTGSFILDYLRYKLTAGSPYGGMTALTDTPATLSSFNLPARTDAESTKNIYWKLQIPASGVAGECGGTINVNAVSG